MTAKEYHISISDAALAMLDSHIDFLARVSADAAINMMEEILANIDSLSRSPERYPVYENPFIKDIQYRKMLSAKQYLVFYEIVGDTVCVDYIVDCRQDYEWLIR
jgi:plasmid stabilization system protein ParE